MRPILHCARSLVAYSTSSAGCSSDWDTSNSSSSVYSGGESDSLSGTSSVVCLLDRLKAPEERKVLTNP